MQEAAAVKKALMFIVLSICMLFSACGKSETSMDSILNKYAAAETVVNEGYRAYDGFLFATDNFICKAEFSGTAIAPVHAVDFEELFGEGQKVSVSLNPSGTRALLLGKNSAYIYDVNTEKTELLELSTPVSKLIGWVGDNVILSESSTSESFGEINIRGKGIPKANVYALHKNKALVKNGNGMSVLAFEESGESMRYYDGESTAPIYAGGGYAVFGSGTDKRIFDIESEKYTELGSVVSNKLRAGNIACVTDEYVCVYTSSATIKRYEIYVTATDSRLDTQRIVLSGDAASGYKGTLIFEDADGNFYFLKNGEYALAETREGQADGLFFIIHPREMYKYDVLGYDAEGHVYEYYADLTL